MTAYLFLLHVAGAVTLMLWAVHMVHTGTERGWRPEITGLLRATNGPVRSAAVGAGLGLALQSSTAAGMLAAAFASRGMFALETGLAIEYNGHVHDGRPRADLDRQRTTLLAAHGITTITVVEAHMQDRGALAEMLYDAREEARRVEPSVRPWTLDQPSWWVPTETVADRRALSTQQRARLLAHRTGDAA